MLPLQDRRDVDFAALRHPPTTFVHDLAGRLRCYGVLRRVVGRPRRCCSSRTARPAPSEM